MVFILKSVVYFHQNVIFSGVSPLNNDVLDGKMDEFNSYADKLFNTNHQRFENSKFKGRSVLHDAAQKGYIEVVKQMVEKSEDKNPQDEHGYTPLHSAARNGHLSIVKFLLPLTSDKNPKSGAQWNERTPLHSAALNHPPHPSWLPHTKLMYEIPLFKCYGTFCSFSRRSVRSKSPNAI